MGIDLMSISGHKIYGPKGIGACYVRRRPRVRLEPILSGGGQERGLRSGTVPAPLVVGFGEACRLAKKEMSVRFQLLPPFLCVFVFLGRALGVVSDDESFPRWFARERPARVLRRRRWTSPRVVCSSEYFLRTRSDCSMILCRGFEETFPLLFRGGLSTKAFRAFASC